MNYIQILLAIKELLPLVIEIIKAIEAAIPGKGKGEAKLEAVREILESGSEFAGDSTVADIWPVLVKVIGSIVRMFNKTNWE